jgi:hypothetical protein
VIVSVVRQLAFCVLNWQSTAQTLGRSRSRSRGGSSSRESTLHPLNPAVQSHSSYHHHCCQPQHTHSPPPPRSTHARPPPTAATAAAWQQHPSINCCTAHNAVRPAVQALPGAGVHHRGRAVCGAAARQGDIRDRERRPHVAGAVPRGRLRSQRVQSRALFTHISCPCLPCCRSTTPPSSRW